MPGAGELKWRIGFYPKVASEDEYGNTQYVYADVPSFVYSALVKPKLGGEAILAGRLSGTNFVNITVRASSDTRQITTDWRAKDERSETLYNIRSNPIDPDGKRVWLEMLCEQGVAA